MKKVLPVLLLVCGVALIVYGVVYNFSSSDSTTSSVPTVGDNQQNNDEQDENVIEDIPIEVVNNTGYTIIANTINNQKGLAVLIHSNEEMNQVLKITTTLTDSNNAVIHSDESYSTILGNDYTIYTTPLVDSEGADLAQTKINVIIDKQGEYMNMIRADMFSLNDESKIEENAIITTLTMAYSGTELLEQTSGFIVALKKNRIIGVSSFSKDQVEPDSVSTIEVGPMNIVLSSKNETIDYDEILVFINNFGF